MIQLNTNYENMLKNINIELNKFLDNNPSIKSFVLGVSGGIDSALVATLAHMFAKDRVRIIGLSLPTMTNALGEKDRADAINLFFCNESVTTEIGTATTKFIDMLMPDLGASSYTNWSYEDKVRVGNIKARIRMIKLYDEARKNNGLVLSTDNYTEYLLGFWTIFGDEGDLGIIQQLFKTEVYGLAEFIVENTNLSLEQKKALSDCIYAKPTDGLGITDNDLEQLNPERKIGTYMQGYKEVDDILIDYLNRPDEQMERLFNDKTDIPKQYLISTPAQEVIINRHLATHFKREHPFNFNRNILLTEELCYMK